MKENPYETIIDDFSHFLCGHGRRSWYRVCRDECSRCHQSHAHHISWHGAYMAVGIALSSDVLASAVSASIYAKHKNLDIKNGLIMMISVLTFTVVGSYISSLLPSATMGSFSVFMTFLLGIKFIVKPVMTTKESMESVSPKKRAIQSVICGMLIGFICGFVDAGGGMMMLLILLLFLAMS